MTYYAARTTPSQCTSPTIGALILVFQQLLACFCLVEPPLLEIYAEGGVTCADLSSLLEAGNFSLEVRDFSAQFLDEGH